MANPTIFASLRTLFIQDATGFRAIPHTPWYWTGTLLIPHPLDSANVPQTALASSSATIGAVTEASLDPTTGIPGQTAPARLIQIGGTDGTALRPLSTTTTGKLVLVTNVVQVDNVSEAAATAFGTFTAPHSGTCRVLAASSVAVTLSLTGAGQTNALGSLAATTWASYVFPVVGGAAYSFQVSAAGSVSLIANVSTD